MDYSQSTVTVASQSSAFSFGGMNSMPNDWLYSSNTSVANNQPPLQEPGSFEDFQFSFGLDPNFAIPVPLDMPPLPLADQEPSAVDDQVLYNITIPSQNIHELRQEAFKSTLLNEDDQRAFSNFLDTLIVDPVTEPMEPLPNHISSLYEQQNYPGMLLDDEEKRHTSILRALDEHKRGPQTMSDLMANAPKEAQRMPLDSAPHGTTVTTASSTSMPTSWPPAEHEQSAQSPYRTDVVYLHKSNSVTPPFIRPRQSSSTHPSQDPQDEYQKRPAGGGRILPSSTTMRRSRPTKELLTAEEKRANHIASEQKRRGTIRNGFKELTDIIPALKNINNSKSTVLFKAVDYIKYLEQRNKGLREKLAALKVRVQVEQRLNGRPENLPGLTQRGPGHGFKADHRDSSGETVEAIDKTDTVAARAAAALRAHKAQQNSLLELQGHLQLHQKMLVESARHPFARPGRAESAMNSSDAFSGATSRPSTKGFRPVRHEESGLRLGYPSARKEATPMDVDATDEPLKAIVFA